MHDEIRSGRSLLNNLDSKIMAILDKLLFESSHSIAERFTVVQSTVLQHLHESLGCKSFHLLWVPHPLTDDLWQKRKEHASAILPFLYTAQRDS
jgi:hypothetical protein